MSEETERKKLRILGFLVHELAIIIVVSVIHAGVGIYIAHELTDQAGVKTIYVTEDK